MNHTEQLPCKDIRKDSSGFMGQVCYILRYCLFLYVYRVTVLYGSWGRFAIYYATVFSYIFTG
jgi:hypothetical protein